MMRILISGSTGFLGTPLVRKLQERGQTVVRLARPVTTRKSVPGDGMQTVSWDPIAGKLDAAGAEGADALVHLAGASIADERWSAERKEQLRTSRVDATRQLMGALANLRKPPRVIVGASAIGYYGNRGEETLTERSAPGNDFLAGVCREWEAETARGAEFGARVVSLRLGIILAAHGGALQKMLLPFKLGVGGRLGNGQQWMSWITLTEVINIIQFALTASELSGPVNTVAPNPVRNMEFTRVLAKALHRPALFPAPPFALRLALGEMADALLLSSARVMPVKLADSGYQFVQPELPAALWDIFPNLNQ